MSYQCCSRCLPAYGREAEIGDGGRSRLAAARNTQAEIRSSRAVARGLALARTNAHTMRLLPHAAPCAFSPLISHQAQAGPSQDYTLSEINSSLPSRQVFSLSKTVHALPSVYCILFYLQTKAGGVWCMRSWLQLLPFIH